MTKPRCVLAYSGGLDTSVAIRWLQEELGYDVITLTVDLGETVDVDAVLDRAVRTGAVSAHVVDARKLFVEQFVFPTLAAGAKYEGVYPLATALARPLIAAMLVDVARREGAEAIAHGCTGKGNDQVRFDVATAALAPEIKVVAPVRDWGMGRPQELEYAARHGIEVPVTAKAPYSIDANLWGRSVESGVLEDPWIEPPADCYALTVDPESAPAGGDEMTITFEAGIPVTLDGRAMESDLLVDAINGRAGAQGVGRMDLVENRLVGIKSREIYEAPAATVLHVAHDTLETLVLARDVARFKRQVADEWARLVYDGLWFSSLRHALGAFVTQTQQVVSGEVRVRCQRGNVIVTGRRAEQSLYRSNLATYDSDHDDFDHSAAHGFIEIFGLPLRTQTRIQGGPSLSLENAGAYRVRTGAAEGTTA